MHVKFRDRQHLCVVMGVRLGVVFGECVITGQEHEELSGELQCAVSDLCGAYGVYICKNSSSWTPKVCEVCIYIST